MFKIFQVVCLIVMMSTLSFAQSDKVQSVQDYWALITSKNAVLNEIMEVETNKMMELAPGHTMDYSNITNAIDGVIDEISVSDVVPQVQAHKDLFLEYLSVYKEYMLTLGNLMGIDGMMTSKKAEKKLTLIYEEITKEEQRLCGEHNLNCE